jgi:hypothetical protein
MKFVAPLMIASGLLLAAATAHATVLANAAGDYNSESLGQMTALPDTDNSGNWLYYMGETDNETTPTSIIRKTVLTYEADPNYQGDFYGTTSSYTFSGTQSSGYELPGVDNSMIFNNNYFPASPGYIEMHPGDAEDATLLEWTAGATETGPVSIAFDLERPNGSGSVNFSVYDDGFQIYELSNITSGSTTDTLDEVIAPGAKIDFVVSGYQGGIAGDASYLSAEIDTAPEPSTYAMLFGGLGMLVLVSRFRSKLTA